MKLTRREFIFGGFGVAGLGVLSQLIPGMNVSGIISNEKIPGSIVGASAKFGHMLRDAKSFPQPTETIETDVAIIGGGIAGLSAAWKLKDKKVIILELEQNLGGNSQSGENTVSPYPWGAHYVPLPTEESIYVRELFEKIGVIKGYDSGLPIYDEYYLCHEPDERLYIYGRWQDGLVPSVGATDEDKHQYREFFSAMDSFKNAMGKDGKRAFAIPLDFSSQDNKFLQYDQITMAEFMRQRGWNSKYLNWYINYCCRDDYGATYNDVSAWAGIHYFASRAGKAANSQVQDVVTWPEGNGWLVKKLKTLIKAETKTSALVYEVNGNSVNYYDVAQNKTVLVKAKAIIMATPHFISARLTGNGMNVDKLSYAPWMVANITLDAMPRGEGQELSWDNVIYDSEMLGYVVATHQNLDSRPQKTVITYYWPLSEKSPKEARQAAIARSYDDWQKVLLTELLRVHPELKGKVRNIDVWLWGHGMVRPVPGYIWGSERKELAKNKPPIFYAHSDMSGISIFEEAQYHGVKAAEAVKEYLAA